MQNVVPLQKPNTQALFSPDIVPILKQMTRFLPSMSPIQYGNVIGVKNNKAYATEGFALLRWTPTKTVFFADEFTLRKDTFGESNVIYPDAERIFPGKNELVTLTIDTFEAIRLLFRGKRNGIAPLVIEIFEGKTALVPTLNLNKYTPKGIAFDANFFMALCRGVPKTAKIDRVVYNDTHLHIVLDDESGRFDMLMVAIKKVK